MTSIKKENSPKPNAIENEEKQKSCFVIMPIADHPNYEPGHFKRVYEHIIAPSCESAGYIPYRADDNVSSNMIMHDILLKIVESEMVICDLSTNNANVFYELGLRQAFNKKTVLITDGRDKTPFDLLGFRYQQYSPTLRVDTVNAEIELISNALIATEKLLPNEVNSIVKLLEIDSANIEIKQPNENQAFMLQMFNSLSAQLSNLGGKLNKSDIIYRNKYDIDSIINPITEDLQDSFQSSKFRDIEENSPALLEEYTFITNRRLLGRFTGYNEDKSKLIFTHPSGTKTHINNTTLAKANIHGSLRK